MIRNSCSNATRGFIATLTLTLGIGGGLAANEAISTHTEAPSAPSKPSYPAAVDVEPTYNGVALAAFTETMTQRREAHIAAEKARQDALVAAARRAKEERAKAQKVERTVVASRGVKSAERSAERAPARSFEATAYTASCTGCTGITATGKDVRNTIYSGGHNIIAVDPNIIPLGSVVRVNVGGDSFTAVAADTGSHIKGNRVDILLATVEEAIHFGRQAVSVQIIRKGD